MKNTSFKRSLKQRKINKIVFEPVLASLLAERPLGRILFGLGAMQAALTYYGCWGWPCPVRMLVGLPCPGCGLSRGLVSLLTGQWQAAFEYHLLSPVLLFVLLLLFIAGCLPKRWHEKLVQGVKSTEGRTGISFMVISGMFVIWVLRVVAG